MTLAHRLSQAAPEQQREWHPRDDFDDEPDDPLQDAIDECGFIPGEGVCMLAGTEWCDWECPFNPCDPEGM